MPSALLNAPYPNRIVLQCNPLAGPFTSDSPLGAFDCTRDLDVYVNGDPIVITSFSFDPNNNRYLMFAQSPILTGVESVDEALVVQLVHHMPSAPFAGLGAGNIIQVAGLGQNIGATPETFSVVQSANASGNQTVTATFSTPVTQGNVVHAILVMWPFSGSGQTVSSVTDTGGNTWLKAAGVQSNASFETAESDLEVWWMVAKATASITVTVLMTGTSFATYLNIVEYGGLDTGGPDGTAQTNVASFTIGETSVASPSASTSAPNGVVFAFASNISASGSNTVNSVDSPFAQINTTLGTAGTYFGAMASSLTTGTYACTFNTTVTVNGSQAGLITMPWRLQTAGGQVPWGSPNNITTNTPGTYASVTLNLAGGASLTQNNASGVFTYTGGASTVVNTVTATGANIEAGDTGFMMYFCQNTNTTAGIASVSDNLGNTWTELGSIQQPASQNFFQIFYAKMATPVLIGDDIVITGAIADPTHSTVNFPSFCNFTGLTTLDQITQQVSTAPTDPVSGTLTISEDEFLISFAWSEGGTIPLTGPTSWSSATNFGSPTRSPVAWNAAYLPVSAQSGSYTDQWTAGTSSVAWAAKFATFKLQSVQTTGLTDYQNNGMGLTGTSTNVITPAIIPTEPNSLCLMFAVSEGGSITPVSPWNDAGWAPGGTFASYFQIAGETSITGNATTASSADFASGIFSFGLSGDSLPVFPTGQKIGAGGSWNTPQTVAFPNANSAGNTIIAWQMSGSNPCPSAAFSDSLGNNYTHAVHEVNATGSLDVWVATNIKAGMNTVTLSPGTVAASALWTALELPAGGGHTSEILQASNFNLNLPDEASGIELAVTVNGREFQLATPVVTHNQGLNFTGDTDPCVTTIDPTGFDINIGDVMIIAFAIASTNSATIIAPTSITDSLGTVFTAITPAVTSIVGGGGVLASLIQVWAGTYTQALSMGGHYTHTIHLGSSVINEGSISANWVSNITGTPVLVSATGTSTSPLSGTLTVSDPSFLMSFVGQLAFGVVDFPPGFTAEAGTSGVFAGWTASQNATDPGSYTDQWTVANVEPWASFLIGWNNAPSPASVPDSAILTLSVVGATDSSPTYTFQLPIDDGTYTSPTSTWGLVLTSTLVNDPSFGFNLQASTDSETIQFSNSGVLLNATWDISPPPFLGGLGLIAAYTTDGDENLPPSASLSSTPAPPIAPNTTFTLNWNTFNVAAVQIKNSDDSFDTGKINTVGNSGSFVVSGGFATTQTLTLHGFDSSGSPIDFATTPTFTVTIT